MTEKQDPPSAIEQAAEILEDEAEVIRECHAPRGDWAGEPEAKADYDKFLSVAAELRRLLVVAPQSQVAAPAAVAVPSAQMTEEIDNILSDPDTRLSPGAERALRWLRTWTDAPLAIAAAPKAVQQFGAGDAVFAFASMLTALPRVVPFGSAAWATPGVELATAFNAANGLSVSLDFPSGIVFPKVDGDLLAVIEKAAAPQPASPPYTHADVLEAHTNGYELGMRQQDRATKPAPVAQGDELTELLAAARDLVETIELMDEDELLSLDDDPHPPSSLSACAQRLHKAIDAARAQAKEGGAR